MMKEYMFIMDPTTSKNDKGDDTTTVLLFLLVKKKKLHGSSDRCSSRNTLNTIKYFINVRKLHRPIQHLILNDLMCAGKGM